MTPIQFLLCCTAFAARVAQVPQCERYTLPADHLSNVLGHPDNGTAACRTFITGSEDETCLYIVGCRGPAFEWLTGDDADNIIADNTIWPEYPSSWIIRYNNMFYLQVVKDFNNHRDDVLITANNAYDLKSSTVLHVENAWK